MLELGTLFEIFARYSLAGGDSYRTLGARFSVSSLALSASGLFLVIRHCHMFQPRQTLGGWGGFWQHAFPAMKNQTPCNTVSQDQSFLCSVSTRCCVTAAGKVMHPEPRLYSFQQWASQVTKRRTGTGGLGNHSGSLKPLQWGVNWSICLSFQQSAQGIIGSSLEYRYDN